MLALFYSIVGHRNILEETHFCILSHKSRRKHNCNRSAVHLSSDMCRWHWPLFSPRMCLEIAAHYSRIAQKLRLKGRQCTSADFSIGSFFNGLMCTDTVGDYCNWPNGNLERCRRCEWTKRVSTTDSRRQIYKCFIFYLYHKCANKVYGWQGVYWRGSHRR